MRWRRRRSDERGAVALEAALVMPVLFVMLLGIIEFAFVMRDYVVVVSDSRVGARIASAGANFGPASCDGVVDPDEVCAPTSAPQLAAAAAAAIQNSGSAMPMENINYILVFRANEQGYPMPDGNTSMACTTECVRFRWVPGRDAATEGSFRYTRGAWNSQDISACFGNGKRLDKVGVYVNTTHQGLTGLFFDELTLDDRATLNFEPLPTDSCGAGGPTKGGHL